MRQVSDMLPHRRHRPWHRLRIVLALAANIADLVAIAHPCRQLDRTEHNCYPEGRVDLIRRPKIGPEANNIDGFSLLQHVDHNDDPVDERPDAETAKSDALEDAEHD